MMGDDILCFVFALQIQITNHRHFIPRTHHKSPHDDENKRDSRRHLKIFIYLLLRSTQILSEIRLADLCPWRRIIIMSRRPSAWACCCTLGHSVRSSISALNGELYHYIKYLLRGRRVLSGYRMISSIIFFVHLQGTAKNHRLVFDKTVQNPNTLWPDKFSVFAARRENSQKWIFAGKINYLWKPGRSWPKNWLI